MLVYALRRKDCKNKAISECWSPQHILSASSHLQLATIMFNSPCCICPLGFKLLSEPTGTFGLCNVLWTWVPPFNYTLHEPKLLFFFFILALRLWVTVSNPAMTTLHYYLRIAWNMWKPALNPLRVPLIPKSFYCSWRTEAEWQSTETTLNFPAQDCDLLCTNVCGMSAE